MKRFPFLISTLLLVGGALPLRPCDSYAEAVTAGNKVQVKVFVERVHKRCPVAIEQTRLEASGMRIEKQGRWQQVGEGLYRIDLIVSREPGKSGTIRIIRDCPKRGLQQEALKIAAP